MFRSPDARRRRRPIAVASILFALAAVSLRCGGGETQPPPDAGKDQPAPPAAGTPPPSGEPVVIRGGERLAWTQAAASLADLRAHSFRFYVDEAPSSLSDVQCGDVVVGSGYECSGRLPALTVGRHVLQVSAVKDGVESARSAGLTVNRVAAQLTDSAPAAAGPAADGCEGSCAGHRVVAELGEVSILASMPDGRLLVVEHGHRVRIVAGDRLVDDPALALDPHRARIVGLAVDPAFADSRAVLVAWTSGGAAGDSCVLQITRYREVGGVLGQAATIVAGLACAAPGLVPLAIDDEGLVYVAMPGPWNAGDVRRADAYESSVLRFTLDGLVPRTNPRVSPLIAAGYARPTGIAVDAAHGRVWLAGSDPAWPHSLSAIALDGTLADEWPVTPAAIARGAGADTTVSLSNREPLSLFAATGRDVRRTAIGPDGEPLTQEVVATLALSRPLLAAADATGALYAAGVTADGGSLVLRLDLPPQRVLESGVAPQRSPR